MNADLYRVNLVMRDRAVRQGWFLEGFCHGPARWLLLLLMFLPMLLLLFLPMPLLLFLPILLLPILPMFLFLLLFLPMLLLLLLLLLLQRGESWT